MVTFSKIYEKVKMGEKFLVPELRGYIKPIGPTHVREFFMVKWSPDSPLRDHLLGIDLRANAGGGGGGARRHLL